MKKFIIPFSILFVSMVNYAQTGIIINSDAKLDIDNAYVKISDGSFINNSSQNQFDGTIVFTGTSDQTIGGSSNSEFSVLKIDNNSNTVSLENNIEVVNSLELIDGILDITNSDLTFGVLSSISGSFSSSNMINVDGDGKIIKEINSNDDILFPIGNTNSGINYSPVELTFNSGTYNTGSASYTIDVTNDKHPENTSTTDYISRYWTITSNGITDFACSATFQYVSGDIIGTESNIFGGVWNGSDWMKLGQASGNNFSGGLSHFGEITGADNDIFSGIKDVLKNDDVTVIYDNGIIKIYSKENIKLSHADLYNSIGQLVYGKDLNPSVFNELTFSNTAGYYFLRLHTNNHQITKKIFLK